MKILIIQIRQLGDVLLSVPIAECIKKHNPDNEVHFLTGKNSVEILQDNPFIDKILILNDGLLNEIKIITQIRKAGYDTIIDVQRTGRSKRITGFSNANLKIAFRKSSGNRFYNRLITPEETGYVVSDRLKLLQGIDIFECKDCLPYFFIGENDFTEADLFLQKNNLEKYILFAPTARRIRKMLPPENFVKLANKLCNYYKAKALITYGQNEKEIAEKFTENLNMEYVLPDKPFKLKVFGALAKKAFIFVGNNSFSSHVALTQNVNSVIFSGPETQWFPKSNKKSLIINNFDNCNGCPHKKDCKRDNEESDYLQCFKNIDSDKVFSKIIENFGNFED